jgi:glutathione synthase/RimK-type ligase-like ATP-grasp enzyme
MGNIFISTHAQDAHALAVKIALERIGHKTLIWIGSNNPAHTLMTIEFESQVDLIMSGNVGEYRLSDFDLIWWRTQMPASMPEGLHAGDRKCCEQEWADMYAAMRVAFRDDAVWINPWMGGILAGMKTFQLKIARRLGLRVPQTRITNDPERVREFSKQFRNGIVHKLQTATAWTNSDRIARSRTVRMTAAHLAKDAAIKLCPGVFQEYIPKAFEVRATFFGETCLAARLASQDNLYGTCDWRSASPAELGVRPLELPKAIYDKCLSLMKQLGITIGCFDFSVTPEGEYVFLEVNENGQFLWVEEMSPDIKMLSAFCNFIDQKLPPHRTHRAFEIAFEEIRQSADFLQTIQNFDCRIYDPLKKMGVY